MLAEHAAYHNAFPLEHLTMTCQLFGTERHLQSIGSQSLYDGDVTLVMEEGNHIFCNRLTNAIYLQQFLE